MPRFHEFEDMKGQPICVNLDRILWAESIPEQIGIVNLVVEVATAIASNGQVLSAPVSIQIKGSRKDVFARLQAACNESVQVVDLNGPRMAES